MEMMKLCKQDRMATEKCIYFCFYESLGIWVLLVQRIVLRYLMSS